MSQSPDAEWPIRQQQIFEAALELFVEQGFQRTTTQDIARRAKVAEGTIFRYFPTKRDLLLGVMAPLASRFFGPVVLKDARQILSEPAHDDRTRLEQLLANRLALAQKNLPLLRTAIWEAPHEPQLRKIFQETVVPQIVGMAEEFMHSRIAGGVFKDELGERTLARMLLSLLMGYVFFKETVPDMFGDSDDQQEITRMVELFLYGANTGKEI